jgi:YHS domain-containing protein
MYKIFIVLCLFLALCSTQALSQKLDAVPVKKVISLELKEKPLKLVAEEIHKQTGYRVVFDEKWNELLLSGQYVGVTPEEFFLRAIRKQNVSLSYDDKGNMIVLRFFGDRDIGKIKAGALASVNGASTQTTKDVIKDPEAIDPVSGMKFVDTQETHKAQRAELERWQKDPESVDPVTGVKLVDTQETHKAQRAELDSLQKNPEYVDPVSGMTNAETKSIHDAQRAELEQLKTHPVAEELEKL